MSKHTEKTIQMGIKALPEEEKLRMALEKGIKSGIAEIKKHPKILFGRYEPQRG